ncbi:MAG: group II intron reverse transcriptase/maturase [Sphaerochaeta sp.]|nr:group II intron reverse transcriptase/maturase [Sphaerochaeta sp.]
MTREGMTVPNTTLCEKLVSDDNLTKAAKKVRLNDGAAGIDGRLAEDALVYLLKNQERIVSEIITRKYKPSPVRRVEIPKANGKKRLLGIPTVRDRIVQQALVQVLAPVFEPTFSDFSFGYRPNRSAEDAVRLAQLYMSEGYNHVVDLDLSQYFDTVDHDILMGLVDKDMEDKDIRRLIFVFLKAGVMVGGKLEKTVLGVPQGGPLSPLLANVYLTPFDKEMEKRGLKFVRYADDCQLFTKSDYAAARVMKNATKYLEGKLKLKVNVEKTEARKAIGSCFLGFTFITLKSKEYGRGMCRPRGKKIDSLKGKLKEITKRNRGVSIHQVIKEINETMLGWLAYYARGNIVSWLTKELLPWLRRRIRQYLWKIWKTAKSRKRHLRKAGVPEWQIEKITGWSSRSYWKMSNLMRYLITNKMLTEYFGLRDFENIYKEWHKKRIERDHELDFNDYLCRQYEEEQEARLLIDAYPCSNW